MSIEFLFFFLLSTESPDKKHFFGRHKESESQILANNSTNGLQGWHFEEELFKSFYL